MRLRLAMGLVFELQTAAFIVALGAAAFRATPRLAEDWLDYTDIIVNIRRAIGSRRAPPSCENGGWLAGRQHRFFGQRSVTRGCHVSSE